MKMYAVLQLSKSVEVMVMGLGIECPLVYADADGMVGAMPVFETREAAEKFAGDDYKIAEIEATQ